LREAAAKLLAHGAVQVWLHHVAVPAKITVVASAGRNPGRNIFSTSRL
jgi:hypothetical protein